jgi:hypothetical protein
MISPAKMSLHSGCPEWGKFGAVLELNEEFGVNSHSKFGIE